MPALCIETYWKQKQGARARVWDGGQGDGQLRGGAEVGGRVLHSLPEAAGTQQRDLTYRTGS